MQTRTTISKIALIGLLLMTSCQSPTGPETSSNLKPSYISGKVVDSTNTAIPGAVIIDLGTMGLKDTAKSDGTFFMTANLSSSYAAKLMAQATGYGNSDTNSITVTPGDTTTTTIRLKSTTGAHVSGSTRAASIVLSTVDNANIALAGTGKNASSYITFLVSDSLKNPVSGAVVKFSISPSMANGGSVLPASAISDAYGKVTTVFSSGSVAGVFKITASANNDSLKGSTTIIVNTGLPAFMSVSLKPMNIAGLLYDNLVTGIVAILTDRNGNPVPNYPINFKSTGGTIQTSNYTANIPFTDQNGLVSVNLISSNNRPPVLGLDTVFAQTVGDTTYAKNDSVIVRAVPVVFSGKAQVIFTTPSPVSVPDSGITSISYRVQDQNGNPLVAGSEYIVSVTDPTTGSAISSVMLTGDADVKMTDTQDTSKTRFTVNIVKTSRSAQGGAANITVTVKSDPAVYGNGNTSNSISGYINSTNTSTAGGSTVFGAAASALSVNGNSTRSISVNESNNDPSAATALSFTIKDSLGNIITNFAGSGVARPLVGFSLIPASGLGGGESLVPAIDSASNSGTVSTVFHAGTKSGIVRVAATLLGTSRSPAYVDVTVSGGYPDSNHISLTLPKVNFPGLVTTGSQGTVSVQMADQFNNPVRTSTPIYFTTTGGAGTIDPIAQTNSVGQASVTLYSGDTSHANGNVQMTTYGVGTIKIVKATPFVFSGAPIITVPDTNIGTIGIGNAFLVNYKVADSKGNPLSSGNTITVTVSGVGGGDALLNGDITVTTPDTKDTSALWHKFTVTNNIFNTKGPGGSITLTISVSGPNGSKTKTISTGFLASTAANGSGYASSIQLLSGSPSSSTVSVKGTGTTETSTMTFVVKDSLGNPVTSTRAATVTFTINGGLNGGEFVSPATAVTDANGKVTTTVNAGTKAGVIQVVASIGTIQSTPVPLTIASGPADFNHFTAWITKTDGSTPITNLSGVSQGIAIGIVQVRLGDIYGNPVEGGTALYFTTNSGTITSSGYTGPEFTATEGTLIPPGVTIYAGNPTPPNDLDTITVSTIGQGGTLLVKKLTPLYSGAPLITGTPATLGTISSGNSLVVNYKVADANRNPLASGNAITVTVGGTAGSYAILSGDVSVSTTDTKDTSTTWHSFTITNNVPSNGAGGTFTITITSTGANGTATPVILTGTLTAPQSSSKATATGTVNYNGQAVRGIKVADKNSVNPLSTYTDASGSFSLTYQLTSTYSPLLVFTDSTLTYATDTVSSITLSPGTSQTVAVTLTKNVSNIRSANQVSVISVSTNHIYSKGVGLIEGNSQLENCKYVLQVKDSAGVAIASTPSYKAKFSLIFYPADGAHGSAPTVNPDSEFTDENGQLPVTIASGTCPGTVQLIVQIALANGNTFQTEITRLNIYSGFADQLHFNLAPEETYPNGWVIPYWGLYGQSHNYDATVADTFGYAVPAGQSVIFNGMPAVGIIGNNGITTTDANGYARVSWLTGTPTPSENGFYTATDPMTSGRKGYFWIHAQTMGKNGNYIQDSILILWNDGAAIINSPAPITMTHGLSSGLVDTLTMWDSNLNPINASITASVYLGANPLQGETFMVYGDISSDPSSPPLVTPAGDFRLQGHGNTYFVFGIADQSTVSTAGISVVINIYITIQNHVPIHLSVPVTVN